jgi:hypothetical protein
MLIMQSKFKKKMIKFGFIQNIFTKKMAVILSFLELLAEISYERRTEAHPD